MHVIHLLILVLCSSACAALAAPAVKPNFILINIDDLGYADIGPFGGKTSTPNLDRMAKEGRKLTSHYAAPVCSPSRASMMTGCYPKRVLPIPHVLFPAGAVGLSQDEQTIAEVLKDTGYATACVGKWHLGDQEAFLPMRQGFDSYYGIPYSNDMGPAAEGSKSNAGAAIPERRKAKKKGKGQGQAPANDEQGIRGDQPPLPLLEDGQAIERVKAEQQHTITQRYTEKAQAFIHANKDKPFFLYLPHSAVHFPLYPGKAFMGKSGVGLYQDWVQEVDWSVGQILETVRELNLDERTLVVFTSDNGGSGAAWGGQHALARSEGFDTGRRDAGLHARLVAGQGAGGDESGRDHQPHGFPADVCGAGWGQGGGGSQDRRARYFRSVAGGEGAGIPL